MSNYDAYLRSALGKYQYADMTKRDILNVFQRYSDLRPNLDSFVFNDGSKKELLSLQGTVPVAYKGNTYNIPVRIWLLDTHPYNPPMVYVTPTSTMQIKPGRHVDSNGRVYLPYLHEWKHPQSDLLDLIQLMIIVFSEEPPVFSKSAAQASRPVAATPYPAAGGTGMPLPGYAPSAFGQTPPTSYPGQNPSYPGYTPYPAQSGYGRGTGYNAATQHNVAGGYPSQQGYAQTQGTSDLNDEQMKESVKSAVADKLRRRMKEIFAQAQMEMDSLTRTRDDLVKGKQTLEDMMAKLEYEQNEVEKHVTLLEEKDSEVQKLLTQMENQDEMSIDEAVNPTTPLYRQLLHEFAQEQATEDTIYYLGEALKRGVIELDVYLKKIRELSTKQFMCRALVQKCRLKAGLPEVVSG